MSSITCNSAAAASAPAAQTPAPARKRPSLFERWMESRRMQAEAELRRHGLRLPRELEKAGLKIGERNEDALPFVR
jgi:hypothetical protein